MTTTSRTDRADVASEVSEAQTVAPRTRRRIPTRRRLPQVLTYVALAAFALVFTYPFIWLVSASFKPRGEVFDNLLIPKTFTVQNYLNIWQEAPIGVWLVNSVVVTALAAVGVTASSALVAWGFAYFRFRGRGLLFASLGAELVRQRVLHLPPAAVLPRPAA
jgi:multiple sugar transport system permease protein